MSFTTSLCALVAANTTGPSTELKLIRQWRLKLDLLLDAGPTSAQGPTDLRCHIHETSTERSGGLMAVNKLASQHIRKTMST